MKLSKYKTMKVELRVTSHDILFKNVPMLESGSGELYPPQNINIVTCVGFTLQFRRSCVGRDVYDLIAVVK